MRFWHRSSLCHCIFIKFNTRHNFLFICQRTHVIFSCNSSSFLLSFIDIAFFSSFFGCFIGIAAKSHARQQLKSLRIFFGLLHFRQHILAITCLRSHTQQTRQLANRRSPNHNEITNCRFSHKTNTIEHCLPISSDISLLLLPRKIQSANYFIIELLISNEINRFLNAYRTFSVF